MRLFRFLVNYPVGGITSFPSLRDELEVLSQSAAQVRVGAVWRFASETVAVAYLATESKAFDSTSPILRYAVVKGLIVAEFSATGLQKSLAQSIMLVWVDDTQNRSQQCKCACWKTQSP